MNFEKICFRSNLWSWVDSYKDNVISIMNEPINVDEVTKKVWLVQYRITNGVDRNYVKGLLGEPSVERTNDDSQQAVWRHDISPIQG